MDFYIFIKVKRGGGYTSACIYVCIGTQSQP